MNEPSGAVQNVLPMLTMDDETWENHSGEASVVTAIIPALASNATSHMLCMCNGAEIHFSHFIQSSGPCYVRLYENPVFTDTGTKLTEAKFNRNFTTSSNAIFYANPSVGAITSASLLWESLIVGQTAGGVGVGGTPSVGGTFRPGFHWIFNKTKNYLLKIHNTAGVEIMVFAQGEWCDHT